MDTTTQAQAANEPTEAAAQAETHPATPQAQRDQLEQLLENPDWQPEAIPAGETAGAETTTDEQRTAGEKSQSETQDGAEPEGEEATGSTDKGGRFRFSDPADRQFAVLRKEGVAPGEAARIAYGIGSPATSIPGLEASAEQADPLKALQDELTTVDKQLKEAGETGAGLLDGDVIALIQKRSDLAADIKAESRLRGRDAAASSQQQVKAAAEVKAAQRTAVGEAAQRFPGIDTDGTAIRVEADRLTALYRGSALMQDPQAPIHIAEQAALNVARASAKANGTTVDVEMAKIDKALWADKGQGKQPVQKKITPASGANGTQRPDKPATEQEKFSGITTLDPREKRAALESLLYGT